jgi:uncharacterized protein (UPF0332 family)
MSESDRSTIFLAKAVESLAGAESESVNGRYNNCANRCYYACFQAAIAALLRVGITSTSPQWSHEFVQGRFNGDLIHRRKLYPATLRTILTNTMGLRRTADYQEVQVNRREAAQALRWARSLVEAVERGGENR